MNQKAAMSGMKICSGTRGRTSGGSAPACGIHYPQASLPWQLLAASGCVLLLAGCMNPNFTRFPTAMTTFPLAENLAYQRQDPFPDPHIGPGLLSTPREYDRPRTPARQAAEQRLLQGLPVGPEFIVPGPPRGGLSRPQSVY